jgi:hypothetical protein
VAHVVVAAGECRALVVVDVVDVLVPGVHFDESF